MVKEPKQCSRGCGQLIYFSDEHKSPKGKFIPMEVDAEGNEYALGFCRTTTDCDPSDHKTILAVATVLR